MKCKVCSSEFKNGRCYSCMIKASWNNRQKVKTIKSNCIICDSVFDKKLIKNNQVDTCSLSCARKLGWTNGSRPPALIEIINCSVCGKEKYKLKCVKNEFKYCSRKCMGIAKDKRIEINCSVCNKKVKRQLKKVKIKNYCSLKCSAIGRSNPNAFWNDPIRIKQYHMIYSHHARISKKLGYNGDINFRLSDWISLLKKYGSKCMCCKSEEKITIDHIKPLHNGGENHIDNIQILCKKCNSSKGLKEIDYRPQSVHGIDIFIV